MAKFEKCPEKRCIHYRIHSDPNDCFPAGITVHFASKQGGRNLLRQAERIAIVNSADARIIRQQIETELALPEAHPADQRPGCSTCHGCHAKSMFIMSPLMAVDWACPVSNKPVN